MPTPLPPEIRIERGPAAGSWRLPHRFLLDPRQSWFAQGCLLAVFLGFGTAFSLALPGALAEGARDPNPGATRVPVLLSLPFAAAGAAGLLTALWMIAGGTCRIRIDAGHVRILEGWGPIGLPRRIPLERLRRIRMRPSGESAFLQAVVEGDGTRSFAFGYPQGLLAALAADLMRERDLRAGPSVLGPAAVEAIAGGVRLRIRTPRARGAWRAGGLAAIGLLPIPVWMRFTFADPGIPSAAAGLAVFAWATAWSWKAWRDLRASALELIIERTPERLSVERRGAGPAFEIPCTRLAHLEITTVRAAEGESVLGRGIDAVSHEGSRIRIADLASTDEASWVKAVLEGQPPGPGAPAPDPCPACAATLSSPVVRCGACGARQHRACREDAGMFAVAGCRDLEAR